MSSSQSNRKDKDVFKLMKGDYHVRFRKNRVGGFYAKFSGPPESLYEGGLWKLDVELPDDYPLRGPTVRFVNRIYHPNVDWLFGTVCLDVLKENWRSDFDLITVFELFLPQLLHQPNPSDPCNQEAALLMKTNRSDYDKKVKEYCIEYAKPEDVMVSMDDSEDIESEESEYDEFEEAELEDFS